MSSTEEAKRAWIGYAKIHSDFAPDFLNGLESYQSSLRLAIEERKKQLWTKYPTESAKHRAIVFEIDSILELLSSVKPKEDRIEKKG